MTTTMGHAETPRLARAGVGAWVRAAPAPLRWAGALLLAWAVAYPALNLFSGMVREQPPGSEPGYFLGFLVAAALGLLVASTAAWFAVRGSRSAQVVAMAALAVQAMLAASDLSRHAGEPIYVPPNLPVPAAVAPEAVWVATILVAACGIALLAMPSVWRHTRGRGLLPQSHVTG